MFKVFTTLGYSNANGIFIEISTNTSIVFLNLQRGLRL